MKLGRLLLSGRFKKRKRRRKEIGEFSFWERNLGLEGRYICEKKDFSGGQSTYWSLEGEDRREEKHKGIGEESNCNQGCPGMILATLGILTHT